MTTGRVPIIKPGMFGIAAAADSRRTEFDVGNETILAHGTAVDFVFIGDSITHWWDVYEYFGRRGKFVVNRGIGGDISSHVLRRFEADVIQLRPIHVVIKIGINNFWSLDGWVPVGTQNVDQFVDEVVSDIHAMVKAAKEHSIIPIVCSILPTHMPGYSADDVRNAAVRRTNGLLQTMANQEGAIYVDYHSKLLSEDGMRLRDGLADDGLHPHVVGYDIMAKTLRETLSQHGIEI